jgi:hypothetical protein
MLQSLNATKKVERVIHSAKLLKVLITEQWNSFENIFIGDKS